MATPIQYESQIPAIAKLLLGEQQKTGATSTTTGSANTLPLEQVFQQALTGGAAGVPEMQALISSIFQEGSKKIPALTQAYANATGSRTTGNSGLALAMGDLNREMSTAAAQAILQNQQANRQIATNAGSSIAQATRSETKTSNQTQTTGTKTNPLLATLLGFGLNKADKSGLLKKLGAKVGGIFGDGESTDVMAAPAYGNSIDFSQPGAMAGDPYGSGTYDLGATGSTFDNWDTGAGSFFDFGGFDGGFGGGDTFTDWNTGTDNFFDLGGSDLGGVTDTFDNWDTGSDSFFDLGGGDVSWDFAPEVGADWADIDWGVEDFGAFFADGGAVNSGQRNRNYMGTAAPRQVVSALNQNRTLPTGAANPASMQPRRRPERTDFQVQESDTGGIGVTDASNTNGVVGTPSQNNAAVMGMVSLGLAPAIGVPSAAINAALSAMGVPAMSMSPMSQTISALAQALGISNSSAGGVGSDGVSPGSVAAATGIDGMNEGGLGGMGVTMGLDADSTGPVGLSADGGGGVGDDAGPGAPGSASADGANAASGEGIGVFADGGIIKGPGTGTSDSIKANVSDGEYIFPADVVRYFGTRTLDRMKGMIHKPAHMSGGKSRMG